MSIINLLRIFWMPSSERFVSYIGLQCLDEKLDNVYTFEGINANGEDWYAYFDPVSRTLTKAINVGPANKYATSMLKKMEGDWNY